jgi:hypothetical protein
VDQPGIQESPVKLAAQVQVESLDLLDKSVKMGQVDALDQREIVDLVEIAEILV